MPPARRALRIERLHTEPCNGRYEFVFELHEESVHRLSLRSRIRFKTALLETPEVIRITSPHAGGIRITIWLADNNGKKARQDVIKYIRKAHALLEETRRTVFQ